MTFRMLLHIWGFKHLLARVGFFPIYAACVKISSKGFCFAWIVIAIFYFVLKGVDLATLNKSTVVRPSM